MLEGGSWNFGAAMQKIVSGELPPNGNRNFKRACPGQPPSMSTIILCKNHSPRHLQARVEPCADARKVLKNGRYAQKSTNSKSNRFVALFPLTLRGTSAILSCINGGKEGLMRAVFPGVEGGGLFLRTNGLVPPCSLDFDIRDGKATICKPKYQIIEYQQN
jgi:hypothetical protein